MDSREQPRPGPGAQRAPIPLNPAAPIPLNPAAPVPLNQAATLANQPPGAAGQAKAPLAANPKALLTLRMSNEAEELEEKPVSVRKWYSSLASAVVHMVVILVLGLITLSARSEPEITLTVVNSLEDEEEEDAAEFETLDLDGAPADTSAPTESEVNEIAALAEPPDFTAEAMEPALWTEGLPMAKKVGLVSAGSGENIGAGFNGLGFGAKLKALNKQGLDLVIVFDCTISMNTEIDKVKMMLARMGAGLVKKMPGAQISLVAYRDEFDEFTHKSIPLTNNISNLSKFLEGIHAGGGGDDPEGVEYGMEGAMADNTFRPEAHKMMLIFGDAPPHIEKVETCVELARKFRDEQGGRVCTITCGRREPLDAFEQIAEAGRGEALTMQDRSLIFNEILISVFGTENREDVIKFFDLDELPSRK